MENRSRFRGCGVGLLLLLLLLVVGVVLLFTFDNPRSPALAEDAPTLFIDILSPESAETLTAGQPVQVLVQTWSLAPLDRLELLVNGAVVAQESSVGVAKPSQTTLRWEVGGAGVHTLLARATDLQGQVEESQTLILNVVALPFMEEVVSAGSSLESISQANGTTVSEVMALNPGLDPAVPLPLGQSIVLPPPNNAPAATTSETLQDPQVHTLTGVEMLIQWTLTTFEPVDQSYCYQSTDGQNWQRSPAQNFNFYAGNQWLQPIMASPTTATVNLFLDCWAWKGGTLTYLGQVQRRVALEDPPSQLTLEAAGFIAQGFPMIKPIAQEYPASEKLPAPFALRAPSSVNECAAHHGHLLAGLVCKQLMTSPVQNYHLMIWEWQPDNCIPGTECDSLYGNLGFQLFTVDSYGQPSKPLKRIQTSGQQLSAVPVPWGPVCYGLRAYASNPHKGIPTSIYSDIVTYCPSSPPTPQKMIVTPADWLSMDNAWLVSGCGGDGPHPPYALQGTQILAGYIKVILDKCHKESEATAIVSIPLVDLPTNAVIQRAELQFVQERLIYMDGTDVENDGQPLCITQLVPVENWVNPYSDHFVYGTNTFGALINNAPYKMNLPVKFGGTYNVDVTEVVVGWQKMPQSNHGFIFDTDIVDLYNWNVFSHGADFSFCYSILNQIQLEIDYFAP